MAVRVRLRRVVRKTAAARRWAFKWAQKIWLRMAMIFTRNENDACCDALDRNIIDSEF